MKRLLPVLMGFALLLLSSTEGWSLPPCPEKGVWNNCFGTYTDDDGTRYMGEWKDDKSHGQGTEIYPWGTYVGEFRDGKKHGQGTYTGAKKIKMGWAESTIRQGAWYLKHAYFSFKYVGEWKDGKKHGQGTLTDSNGRVEEGIWENDVLQ